MDLRRVSSVHQSTIDLFAYQEEVEALPRRFVSVGDREELA